MATIIPIKDNPNHTLTIELDSSIYKLGFLYNTVGNFWAMTIWDGDDTLLLSGLKVVANYPLMFAHKNELLPTGDFYCEITDTKASVGRNSFSSNEAELLYLSKEEVATI